MPIGRLDKEEGVASPMSTVPAIRNIFHKKKFKGVGSLVPILYLHLSLFAVPFMIRAKLGVRVDGGYGS